MEKKKKIKKPVAKKASSKEKPVSHSIKKEKTKIKELPIKEEVAIQPAAPEVLPPAESLTLEEEKAFQAIAGDGTLGKSDRYWEAVGRRKEAVARVRLFTRGDKLITVNGKPYGDYFFIKTYQKIVEDSLQKMKSMERFRISVKIVGGGLHAQAEATRHGIARALVKFNPDFRKRLRRAGFLTRDPRMKERKKFGLRGARRAPQWAKR